MAYQVTEMRKPLVFATPDSDWALTATEEYLRERQQALDIRRDLGLHLVDARGQYKEALDLLQESELRLRRSQARLRVWQCAALVFAAISVMEMCWILGGQR